MIGGKFYSSTHQVQILIAILIGIKKQRTQVFSFFIRALFSFEEVLFRKSSIGFLQKKSPFVKMATGYKEIVQLIAIDIGYSQTRAVLRQFVRQQGLQVEIDKIGFLMDIIQANGSRYICKQRFR